MGKYKNTKKLLVAKDLENSAVFTNEKDRIRYMSDTYGQMGIGESFKKFYEIEGELEYDKSPVNDVPEIEIGQCYIADVKEINKHHILFDLPGVKEELVCKENFNGCMENVQNYLLTHDNKLIFEVRGYERGKYIVSVLNGMYRLWKHGIEKAMTTKTPIEVHIDSLTLNQSGKGGYLCHTTISTLKELTGREYTHSVFIPGSAIVLNIESDFNKWIDEDVLIIPQKFVEFRTNYREGVVENSLVGSRKLLLQMKGNVHLFEIYNKYLLTKSENFKAEPESLKGHVTGIINSGKKTGVFVELDGMYITGLMPVDKMDLMNFKPGDEVTVYPMEFEVKEGQEPFVTNKKGDIIRCNTRVVFGLVG